MGDRAESDGALTRDAFFGGRLMLQQPAKGHRGGTDAVLLAAAVPRDFAGLLYDAGAGVGTAGLGAALTCPAARVGLVESDPLSARLAATNIAANGLADRVGLHACDLLSPASRNAVALDGKADLVITNPPFYALGAVRESSDPRRRAAHVSGEGGLEAWIVACLALLNAHGTLILIHRAEALPDMLAALQRRAGAVTVLPVHTKAGEPAKRVLARAVKGSRAPLAIAPGLVLRDDAGFTVEVERINRGEAGLGW
ncbi:tRNA1(Val) (adenine(37)-N6)-methyltransferase [Beijerinckia sp. L45]|uniref:tRNA1(Val) (adenine(37)-N6)-methyltransferase n=1 Tax=Beijerinckia sp. L45 TaxID=1641855 RepID=UPI00131B2BEF|nr:methyltransferase [Beijerinckia sp. L45]